jgi:hypothetical protein
MTTGNEDNHACDRCFSGEYERKCDNCRKYPGPGDSISLGNDGSYFCSRCKHKLCDDCGKEPGPGDSLQWVSGRGKSLCSKCGGADRKKAHVPVEEKDPDAAVRCMRCRLVFDKSQLIPIRQPSKKPNVPKTQIGVMCRRCYDEKTTQTAVYVKQKQCDFCKDKVGSGSLTRERVGSVIKYRCGDPRCMVIEEAEEAEYVEPVMKYRVISRTADGEPLGALSVTMPSSVREKRAARAARQRSVQKPQDSCTIL